MKTPELKPCPFCGGRAVILSEETPTFTFYFASCIRCGIKTPHLTTKRDVFNKWNRRIESEKA